MQKFLITPIKDWAGRRYWVRTIRARRAVAEGAEKIQHVGEGGGIFS